MKKKPQEKEPPQHATAVGALAPGVGFGRPGQKKVLNGGPVTHVS